MAWYRWLYAPRTGGAYDSHHRTAGIAGRTRRRGGRVAARGARAAILGHTGGWMEIDLHGYDPRQIVETDMLAKIVQQAWEMGEPYLRLIHGHGRMRGISPGFVNTNTGFFGLQIRRALRHDEGLRKWIKHTTLDCHDWGCTTVKLKPNFAPVRSALDPDLLPDRMYK